ncbi:Rab1a [Hexamita inflata]|uniref:Rab1a n=1 Tax=Hexamita inflata TaxID=28002 RepID=A0AA86V3T8_9EUKA|nr:Rab1a [Hexamita inflata]
MTQTNENEVKLVMLGEAYVGKTSILYRFMSDQYSENLGSTITASFYKKKVTVQNSIVQLQLWDTAGLEKFKSITPLYYRTADVILVVFAVDSIKSFEKAVRTIEEVRIQRPKPNIILLGNKTDLNNQTKEQAESFSQISGYKLFWMSALNGNGIQEAFQEAVLSARKNEGDNGKKKQFKMVKENEERKGCC